MKMGRGGGEGGGYRVQESEASCQQAEWIADRNYYVAYLGKQGQNQIIDSWRGIWCELIISPFHFPRYKFWLKVPKHENF